MLREKDPKFLKEKLTVLEKISKTSSSPSELERVRRCINKTRKRLRKVTGK